MTAVLHPRMFPIWLLALLMLWMASIAGTGISHAVARHGADALAARTCSEGGNGMATFFNGSNGRYAEVCQVNGRWAVRILDKMGREITAFVKGNVKSFDEMLKYMHKTGYELLQ